MKGRHGGQILTDQLSIQGCEAVFCVPGESYLAVLDGLYNHPTVRTVVCRQEGGAAIMAEAWGKMSGRPGVCFVTRGPGATNASPGVHIAAQDSTPMILCIGQVGRGVLDREAFQEVDYRTMFGGMAKWVGQVDDTARIPEYVSHAFHLATAGRPGPVVVVFPEDVLAEFAEVEDARPATPLTISAAPEAIEAVTEMLQGAERPLLVVGGGGWTADAARHLSAFAKRANLPVAASFRCQDYIDNREPVYIGDYGVGVNPKLAQRARDCDLLIVLGARLGELSTSGYSLVNIPNPRQRLVHIHPGADELGRVYRPDLAINASSHDVAERLDALTGIDGSRWKSWAADARSDYEQWIEPRETPGDVKLEQVLVWLRENLSKDAIITNGAGNYTAWVHRYYQYSEYRTQLAPTSGSMGYGVPAAVSAKLVMPERTVVCFSGDGCFQMHGQELATAVQYNLPIIIVVANNGMYATIRMHQERHYPGRVNATNLVNPDFAALARAYGAHGERVQKTADFPSAFERARRAGRPALIELSMDPEALSPRMTLSEARAAGEAAQTGETSDAAFPAHGAG